MRVVMTTINAPTEAVAAFAALPQVDEVVVVGDRRTPTPWEHPGCRFLAADAPLEGSRLQPLLPWNHYSRKNLGYLAVMRGAAVIAESDDDNSPYPDWGFPEQEGDYLRYAGAASGIVNHYSWFSQAAIWPRGLPLHRVLDPAARIGPDDVVAERVRIGLWQGLADGDPDVDAVYRLTSGALCDFDKAPPVVFTADTTIPVNSQNTAWYPDLFAAMYLPATVTFRYTDILRGVVAAAVAQTHGLAVGAVTGTVYQDRNPHDLMRDFESECSVYLTVERAWEVSLAAARQETGVGAAVAGVYDALAGADIVARRELDLVAAWLLDVETATGSDRFGPA